MPRKHESKEKMEKDKKDDEDNTPFSGISINLVALGNFSLGSSLTSCLVTLFLPEVCCISVTLAFLLLFERARSVHASMPGHFRVPPSCNALLGLLECVLLNVIQSLKPPYLST